MPISRAAGVLAGAFLILLNILRDKGVRITLIGDPDQCIYEFSMADAESLPTLQKQWGIPEFPLSQSFRCNDLIAKAVRNVGGNAAFVGCGKAINEFAKPFILRESDSSFVDTVAGFERLLDKANIPLSNGAILCRAHRQLESVCGNAEYIKLRGTTKDFALAAFHRDIQKDFRQAQQIVECAVREMTDDQGFWEALDEDLNAEALHSIRLAIWRFTKSRDGLPSLDETAEEWIDKLKSSLTLLFVEIGVTNVPKMGYKIKRTGLDAAQLGLPLFEPQPLTPKMHRATIHQVKG